MEKIILETPDAFKEEVTAVAITDKFIALGLNNGYKVYSMIPIKLIKSRDLSGEIGQIGFYNDKIIWFVGGGLSPAVPDNELRLLDNYSDEQLLKIVQKTSIKKVCIKNEWILTCSINKVYLYTLPLSEKILKFETIDNPFGVIAMNEGKDHSVVAFLSKENAGELIVYDYENETELWKITGNDSEFFVTCLALSQKGEKLAVTTSEGCTIHLYDTNNGSKLIDFTRGSSPANFSYLRFQIDDTRLLVSADTGTVHIFMVEGDKTVTEQAKNYVSYFSFLGKFIPYLSKIGSYCKFRIEEKYSASIMPDSSSIISLTGTGKMYIGQINVEEGGEAAIESVNSLLNLPTSASV